jgi:hypothetical protein
MPRPPNATTTATATTKYAQVGIDLSLNAIVYYMGIFSDADILGVRILVCFADAFTVLWEHIGNDWKNMFELKKKELESRYGVLYYQVLRNEQRDDDNVDGVWYYWRLN